MLYGVCKCWKVKKYRCTYREKCLRSFLVHGRHGNAEMHMHSDCHLLVLYSLQVWEVKKSFLVKKCLRLFCSWLSWKRHTHQVSLPCIAWFTSLRSEEVVIRKSAWGHLFVVVMETLKYTCVPSFTSMHCMVCKIEKWRSSYREKCPRQFFVSGCHGNPEIHMCTKFPFHALYGVQVWEVKK